MAPPGRLELPPPASEAGTLSAELRGPGIRSILNRRTGRRVRVRAENSIERRAPGICPPEE